MGNWPLIIIGMHRSGTTMISKILENLGIFMGVKKEINNEAVFFIKINDWIMEQFNASWDQPYNMNYLSYNNIAQIKKAITRPLKDIRAIEFLGLKYYLKFRDIRKLNFPWGWKDPRTTFTIDIWKEIFPKAKILHIYRNPIDISESLRKREEELNSKFKMTTIKRIKEFFLKGKIGYVSSCRLHNIYEGINLWKQYIEKSFSLSNNTINILHIRYEDILTDPKTYLDKIFSFVEIPYSKKIIENAMTNIQVDRKYAFTKNHELLKIYNEIKNWPLMKNLGYDNITS
jgi:hypothetical protein